MADEGEQEFEDLHSDEEEEEDADDDDLFDERNEVPGCCKITGKERRSLARMTSFEYARLVTTRGEQINGQSRVGIIPISTDALIIPQEELAVDKCPLYINRPSGSGKGIESWHSNELEIMDIGLSKMPLTPIQRIGSMTLEQIVGLHVVWPKITQPQPAKESEVKIPSRKRESSTRRSLVHSSEEIKAAPSPLKGILRKPGKKEETTAVKSKIKKPVVLSESEQEEGSIPAKKPLVVSSKSEQEKPPPAKGASVKGGAKSKKPPVVNSKSESESEQEEKPTPVKGAPVKGGAKSKKLPVVSSKSESESEQEKKPLPKRGPIKSGASLSSGSTSSPPLRQAKKVVSSSSSSSSSQVKKVPSRQPKTVASSSGSEPEEIVPLRKSSLPPRKGSLTEGTSSKKGSSKEKPKPKKKISSQADDEEEEEEVEINPQPRSRRTT